MLLGNASSGSERNSPVTMISSMESSGAAAPYTLAHPHSAQIDRPAARDFFTRMSAPFENDPETTKQGGEDERLYTYPYAGIIRIRFTGSTRSVSQALRPPLR